MNYDQLEAFYFTIAEKSFSGGAKALGITQSALSQRVAKLEDTLEVSLIIRDTKGIRPTQAGEKVIRYYKDNLSLIDELKSSINIQTNGQLSGQIHIAGYSSITRSVIIPGFTKLLKENTNISYNIQSCELNELEGLLRSSAVDFIITHDCFEKNDLTRIKLGIEQFVLVSSPNESKENKLTFLDHDSFDQVTYKFFLENKMNYDLIQRRYLDDIYSIIDGVRQGLGRAIISKHLINTDKKIKIIHSKKSIKLPVYLYYYKKDYYPKLQIKVIEILQSAFKNFK